MRKVWIALALSAQLSLSSCGGDSGQAAAGLGSTATVAKLPGGTTSSAPPTTTAPAPAPSPSPTPAPAPAAGYIVGTNTADGFPQLDSIPTNFAKDGLLQPSWGTGAIAPVAEDVLGAFRFLCKPSHLAYDDPIVYPGQKGKAHLHLFFGNTAADGDSTYQSLRTSGNSTCNNALNRSAYWMPALYNGLGQIVMPEYLAIYYKRLPKNDPACLVGKGCIGLPRGLRYVFGRTADGAWQVPKGHEASMHFNCDGKGAVPGNYVTLVEAAKNCPTGALIGALLASPSCWDGVNLDSPNHRSHMAYTFWDGFGVERCPDTHPYRVPTFTVGAWYMTDDTLDRSGNMSPTLRTWYYASDRMPGMTPLTSGLTFHADWFGAWDDQTIATWLANCVDKKLNCSGGDLGNGTQLKYSADYLATRPRLVDVPVRP